ncbi:hypothetical protein ABKV19_020678 [Rosa sericea]
MIKVKTLTGKEIEIDIEPTDTIDRIKERVEEKEEIPLVQQRVTERGLMVLAFAAQRKLLLSFNSRQRKGFRAVGLNNSGSWVLEIDD